MTEILPANWQDTINHTQIKKNNWQNTISRLCPYEARKKIIEQIKHLFLEDKHQKHTVAVSKKKGAKLTLLAAIEICIYKIQKTQKIH